MSIKFFGYVLAILGFVVIFGSFGLWIAGVWTIDHEQAHHFFMTGWITIFCGVISTIAGCIMVEG